MKLLKVLGISSLIATYHSVVNASTTLNIQQEKASTFELFDNFRTPKNIMFSCMFGGSSHVAWVLSIMDELASRGHSTYFLTRDDQVKFTKNYPQIKTTSIGPGFPSKERENAIKNLRSMNIVHGIKGLLESMTETFPADYVGNRDFINSNDIDVAICDHFGSACVEAALASKIPFIITGTFPLGPDAAAPYINNEMTNMMLPTTEYMSLRERLYDMIIRPIHLAYVLRKNIQSQKEAFMTLGLTPPLKAHHKWTDAVKIVNTAFGFEAGRPLGPLMEFVGPILPRKYPVSTDEVESFLDTHSKVAYIAFGQHAIPLQSDGRLLLTALLESLESGDIDGIVWATRNVPDMFPAYVTTSSNTTYHIRSFNDSEGSPSNVLFLNWAPQMAILQHPSTAFFVTHGGAGSLYESLFSGKRVVVYPFFGDQLSAALISQTNGIGLKLDCKKSQENANQVIRRVARDESGLMQGNTNRFKALVQIRSKHGVIRAADIVEEVAFMQIGDGKVPHRYDVKRNLSFMKANNYDIYLFLIVLAGCIGYGVFSSFNYFINPMSVSATKAKTL